MTIGSRGTGASDRAAIDRRLLFCALNDQIDCLLDERPPNRELTDWVCERADTNCCERVGLTRAGFDAVRGEPEWFAVKIGHTNGEQIIETYERYLVVGSEP